MQVALDATCNIENTSGVVKVEREWAWFGSSGENGTFPFEINACRTPEAVGVSAGVGAASNARSATRRRYLWESSLRGSRRAGARSDRQNFDGNAAQHAQLTCMILR